MPDPFKKTREEICILPFSYIGLNFEFYFFLLSFEFEFLFLPFVNSFFLLLLLIFDSYIHFQLFLFIPNYRQTKYYRLKTTPFFFGQHYCRGLPLGWPDDALQSEELTYNALHSLGAVTMQWSTS